MPTLRLTMADARRLGVAPKPKAKRRGRPAGNVARVFELACEAHGLPIPVAEFPFAKDVGREFKADYAFLDARVILEIEGGIFGSNPCPVCNRPQAGGHSSITGIKRDIEKYNLAVELGWRLVRCLPEDVSSGAVFTLLKRYIPVAERK